MGSYKLLLGILLIILLACVAFVFWPRTSAVEFNQAGTSKPSEALKAVVTNALQGTTGEYGIVIFHLGTGEMYFVNENKQYEAASLYKLWIMATAYSLINDKKLSETSIMKQDAKELNEKFDIASESAEIKEGPIEMTVDTAITRMITISDNYAALLLSSKIGLAKVRMFLDEFEFGNSKISVPPKTTAIDIAKFFYKLYKGELINKEYSDKMLTLLKKQQLNNGIPRLLPEGIAIAHKTGELGGVKHDAGIVYSQKGDYIIVVLSKSSNPLGAQQRISEISLAVYNYFNK